jgi:hypothetical protein
MSQVVKTPGVKSIHPVRLYERPESVTPPRRVRRAVNNSGPETYDSNASPHMPTVSTLNGNLESKMVLCFPASQGVDTLHRMGIFGAGVTVAM